MANLVALRHIAKVIRSKNAGPFETTIDIIFGSADAYQAVKRSGCISRELILKIYGVPTQLIQEFVFFDKVNAIKITIPRHARQGGIGETDMHAAQQHAPLLDVMVPWEPQPAPS
jgi:hypothetical protein